MPDWHAELECREREVADGAVVPAAEPIGSYAQLIAWLLRRKRDGLLSVAADADQRAAECREQATKLDTLASEVLADPAAAAPRAAAAAEFERMSLIDRPSSYFAFTGGPE